MDEAKETRCGHLGSDFRGGDGLFHLTGRAKRLTNVTSQAGSFAYLLPSTRPSPLVTRLSLPNSSYITNTYDSVARLTGTWLKNSSHSTLNSHQYTYNQGNQRTQQVFNAGSTYNYTYDAIGQLKIADSGTASEDRGYVYDAAWNLNYRTNNTTLNQFKVDPKNQLTNAFSAPYSYDGNGNLIWGNSSRNNYVYDDENRLVQWFNYYNPNGSPLVSGDLRTDFVYDGLGRLRSRAEYGWTGSSWYPNGTTYYIYDGMRVIQERTTAPSVSYTRGSDLSGSLEGAGGIGGLLARSHGYASSNGNWYTHNCYHADGNGNITYVVNSSQTLAASYRYDPYGNTISSSGGLASANVYRFSSKELHANSGLYYYGYRWYHPNLQRWPNRDPIAEAGGINLYVYVGNNPVNVVDFLGLEPGDIGVPRPGTGGPGQNCMGHALCDSGKWEQGPDRTNDNPWPEEKYLKDKGCREIKCDQSCDSGKKEQKVKLYEWKNADKFHIVRQNGDKWSGKTGTGPIYDFPDPDKHTSEAYKIKPEDWRATCWCCPCKK